MACQEVLMLFTLQQQPSALPTNRKCCQNPVNKYKHYHHHLPSTIIMQQKTLNAGENKII